jgi:hypothetical protein
MKKIINKKILGFLMLICCMSLSQILIAKSVYADCQEGYAETVILNCVETENGCGLFMIINIVLTVITAGVTVLGILGIIISSIMYASARDNEDQVAKAKKRIMEVIIGLALWVFLYIIIQFLLPGGFMNNTQTCKIIPPMTAAEIRARNNEINKKSNDKMMEQLRSGQENDNKNSDSQKIGKGAEAKQNAINDKAIKIANSGANNYVKTARSVGVTRRRAMCCGCYVSTVIRSLGIDKNFPTSSIRIYDYFKKHPNKWQKQPTGKKSCQVGDVMLFSKGDCPADQREACHSAIVVNKNGKKAQAEASLSSYPKIKNGLHTYGNRDITCYRYIGN